MPIPSFFRPLQTRAGASRALMALAIPGSALALGSLHTPVLAAVAALLACATLVAWWPAAPSRTRLPATFLFVAGVVLTAYTALQAVPLPAGVVRALAPATADVWSRALTPLREGGPAWMTLSLDPIATRVEVLRGAAYICAFLVALRIAEAKGGTAFLSWVIVLSSLVVAFSAVLHPMFGMRRVFGVYSPADAIEDRHIAPLLNPNHLAAYLNVGFCLALGMVLGRRRERYRPILAALALLLGATEVWVASRGGTVALFFGAAVTVGMTRISRRFAVGPSVSVVMPLLAVVAGVGMVVIGAGDSVSSELTERNVGKVALAIEGLRLVPQHAIFGVGRGAFQVAFPAVRSVPGYSIVTHPENIVVQWITEWGLPMAIGGAAALAYALRPRVLLVSSSPAIGAWSAIATVLVHNLVDFNSEVPAVGVLVAVCAAMVVAGRGNTRSGALHRWAMHPRVVGGGAAALVCAAALLALGEAPHELDSERADLYRAAAGADTSDEFAAQAREALRRHPSEPYLPFIASVAAARRGRSVLPWIERTLELAPVYPPAHIILGSQLASISPSQARLEYRLAMSETRDDFARSALRSAVKLVKSYDDALEILPPDPEARADVLAELARDVETSLPSTRVRLDGLLEKLEPNAREPLARTAEGALADLELGEAAPWCVDRTRCVAGGLSAADRLGALDPGTCAPAILRARLYIASDDAGRGLQDLATAAQAATDPLECWRSLADLAARTNNDVFVSLSEEQLARSGCAADVDCANNLMEIAALEERRGNARGAIKYYERARQRAPDRADIVEKLASVCAAHGLHAEALDAYRALQRLAGDERWAQAVEREKAELYAERSLRDADGGAALGGPATRGFSSGFERPFGDRGARRAWGDGDRR